MVERRRANTSGEWRRALEVSGTLIKTTRELELEPRSEWLAGLAGDIRPDDVDLAAHVQGRCWHVQHEHAVICIGNERIAIVDWYHATEYVWTAAKALYGEDPFADVVAGGRSIQLEDVIAYALARGGACVRSWARLARQKEASVAGAAPEPGRIGGAPDLVCASFWIVRLDGRSSTMTNKKRSCAISRLQKPDDPIGGDYEFLWQWFVQIASQKVC